MDYEDFGSISQEDFLFESNTNGDHFSGDFFDWDDDEAAASQTIGGNDADDFIWDDDYDTNDTIPQHDTISIYSTLPLAEEGANTESHNGTDVEAHSPEHNWTPYLDSLSRDTAWTEFKFEDVTTPRTKEDIARLIEDLFASLLDAITQRSGFSVTLRSRRQNSTGELSRRWNVVRFPGRSVREDWKFACLIRVLELMHEALVMETVTAKRDIYYKDVQLFKSQSVVDRIVDDLGYTFDVQRSTMNVTAAAKGLVCGNVTVYKKDGTVLDCSSEGEGTLIPPGTDIVRIDVGDSKWALVIEKEATFRSLAEGASWDHLGIGRGVLVCGKGYPDVSTREFVKALSMASVDLALYGLVDLDPHGIEIFATYKFGSAALRHQNSQLAVPQLKHLGVKFRDLKFLCSKRTKSSEEDSNGQNGNYDALRGAITMTKRDRRKASLLLHRIEDEELREELRLMLYTGKKAEIQILGSRLELHLDTELATLGFL